SILIQFAESHEAGVVNDYIQAAEAISYFGDDALDPVAVEHVETPALDGPARGLDFIYHLAQAGLIDVGGGDHRAFLREEVRGRTAHPAGGAGDQYRAVFN